MPSGATIERAVSPRLVLFALAVGGFAIGTNEFAAMGLLPYFAETLGIDEPTAGHVISAYALGVVLGAPLIAVVAARMSRRTALIWLMGFFGIANVLVGLAPTYGTMIAFRFLAGLPHGAYFGVAVLLAASLVPRERRTRAGGRVLLGLTIATIVGVPAAQFIGQTMGWRWAFEFVAVIALACGTLIYLYAPRDRGQPEATPLRELDALRRPQVWLALGMGAIGFGGMFAVYTYLSSTLLEETLVSEAAVPLFLALFGVGMTIGNLFGSWAADRALIPTIAGILIWSAGSLFAFSLVTDSVVGMGLVAIAVGGCGGLAPPLQTRLMDVAGHAQTLAAALVHSALNVANALGPFLAGLTIAAGLGWSSAGWVGAMLPLAGLVFLGISIVLDRRQKMVQVDAG
ncbi:MAG: MFS transporter [Bauldia sp.]|nr:MFS transporter [Bauldia sp.]